MLKKIDFNKCRFNTYDDVVGPWDEVYDRVLIRQLGVHAGLLHRHQRLHPREVGADEVGKEAFDSLRVSEVSVIRVAVRAVVKTDLQKNMIRLDVFLCLHLCQVGILKRWQSPHVILPLGQFAVVDEGVGQELLQRK